VKKASKSKSNQPMRILVIEDNRDILANVLDYRSR